MLMPGLALAQDVTGDWNGILRVQGMELRLVFHIARNDSSYTASLDSPDQKAFGIPASAASFKDSVLTIEIAKAGIRYQGRYGAKGIEGTFFQSGQSFPLSLGRTLIEKKVQVRPQEPKEPYPYASEEVKFPSEGGQITMAGTLTIPPGQKKFPVAILISGSGPQNRDEEFMTHKPFLVLADHLTKNGIAVLRYDDRGFGQSTGNHGNATSADFAKDVRAAIAYLQTRNEIDHSRIGLIGHSEGGLIAPMVAADTKVAFTVLLAAPGIPGSEILLKQVELATRQQGVGEKDIQEAVQYYRGVYDLFRQYGTDETFTTRLTDYLNNALKDPKSVPKGVSKEEFIKFQVGQFKKPWLRYFLTYDPAATLQNVHCPVLALNGGKDVQVTPENLQIIEKAVRKGGNDRVTVKAFPDMNHLFQICKTGAIDEYATIDQTIDPTVLEEISNWVLKQTR